jgi:hypothetical protein
MTINEQRLILIRDRAPKWMVCRYHKVPNVLQGLQGADEYLSLFTDGNLVCPTTLPLGHYGAFNPRLHRDKLLGHWTKKDSRYKAATVGHCFPLLADPLAHCRVIGSGIVNERYYRLFPPKARWAEVPGLPEPLRVYLDRAKIGIVMPFDPRRSTVSRVGSEPDDRELYGP